jgi:hypothetical protein
MGKAKSRAKKLTAQQRHERDCKICRHPQRARIEQDWIGWGDTTRIAKQYHVSRDSVYRHAHALQLFGKRERNIRAALERIIEHAEHVEVTGPTVVSAIQAYAKINAQGQWVERTEHVDLKAVFDRMTREELDVYAREGKLPPWFSEFAGATRIESLRGSTGD